MTKYKCPFIPILTTRLDKHMEAANKCYKITETKQQTKLKLSSKAKNLMFNDNKLMSGLAQSIHSATTKLSKETR